MINIADNTQKNRQSQLADINNSNVINIISKYEKELSKELGNDVVLIAYQLK